MKDEIKDIINKWFNIKYELYKKMENSRSIYLYYDDQEYADIWVDKKFNCIYYNVHFQEEFSEIFPMEISKFKQFMVKWIEDALNLIEIEGCVGIFKNSWLLKLP